MLALIRRVPSWSLAVLASFIAWANFVALPAAAVVPATLQVEGALLSAQGTPAPDGVYTLDLTLYDAPEGGAQLWQEAGAKVDVKGGAFQHVLGLATPLKAAVLVKASSVWFGVRVGQDPELPRKGLRSVAFALAAVLVAAGLAKSNSEVRRLVTQGAVSVNGAPVTDAVVPLQPGDQVRVGRHRFLRIEGRA